MKVWPIRVLETVVETGSLQQAAEVLSRTPPALSMTLRKLEQEAGFAVLDRSGYRLQLTERGTQFLRHARELVRQQERLNSVVELLRGDAEPRLQIGFDYTCNPEILTEPLRQVQQHFPVTEVFLNGYSRLGALHQVREGDVQLALTPWLPTFQQLADFETVRIGQFDLVVAVAPSLLPDGQVPANRNELAELPYLLPEALHMGIDPEEIYRIAGSSRLRVNDSQTMATFLRAGLGWGVVPRQLVAHDLASKQLLEVNIPGFLDHIQAEIRLAKLATTQPGPAGQVVWDYFATREAG